MRLNPNELFPRLSITAKLAIAFVILAVAPLALVSALGTVYGGETLHIRDRGRPGSDLEETQR